MRISKSIEMTSQWGGLAFHNCTIPEQCIDALRLPLFIARPVLRDLIAGLRADAMGVRTA